MHGLTKNEVTEWLRVRSIPVDPYHGECESTPAYYLQFHPPTSHRQKDAFLRDYLNEVVSTSEHLVHITDWGLYKPSEMLIMDGIRALSDEKRLLIDAPGHVLTGEENETIIALFGLSASFEWSAYLYSNAANATLFNWEGELFDFWTDDKACFGAMENLVKSFKLERINR